MHLYVHIPFCARRCSYCDFAIAVRRAVPGTEFAKAVLAEWRTRRDLPAFAEAGEVETLYLGGGTPSLLQPESLADIVRGLTAGRPLAPEAEVTLEVNPDDVTGERAAAWRRIGVTRVSLGVQSFSQAALAWMHRTHRVEQVRPAVELLRRAGIAEISLDLIFALPNTVDRDWEADLTAADALEPDHLSVYGLTVEPHTPLARWVTRGLAVPVDDGRYAAEFLTADGFLRERGYRHYEVSNACRLGHIARHNTAYWRRAPYVGLGPSAHSAWGSHRCWNLREWEAYRAAVGRGASAVAGAEDLDSAGVALENLYLGLRTDAGVTADRVPAEARDRWCTSGWATVSGGRVRLTPSGWLRLDALVVEASAREGESRSLSPTSQPS